MKPITIELNNKIGRYLVKILVAAVILTLPLSPRLGNIAMLLLGAFLFLNLLKTRTYPGLPFLACLLMLAYGVRIIWLIGADDFVYGLRTLETEIPLLALPLIFSLIPVNYGLRRFITQVYVTMFFALTAVVAIKFIFYLMNGPYPVADLLRNYLDPKWFWGHSRYFSQNMLTWSFAHYSFLNVTNILGLHLFYFLENKTRWEKRLLLLYIILCFLFVIMTGSRIGLGLYAFSLLSYAALAMTKRIQSNKIFVAVGMILFCVTIFALIGFSDPLRQIDSTRKHYAERAVNAWMQSFWFGHGTGDVKFIMEDPDFERKVGYWVNHPHNQYLSELAMYGIIGAVPLFMFLGWSYYSALQLIDKTYLVTILTIAIFMIFECPINSNKGIMPMMLTICTAIFCESSSLKRYFEHSARQVIINH